MNVAIIAPSVFPIREDLGYGGSEIVIHNLCAGLSEIGFDDYTLIAPKGSVSPNGKLIETIDPPSEFGDEEKRAWDIYNKELGRFDLINDHTHLGFPLRTGNVPIVHVFHGLQTWQDIHRRDIDYVVLSEFHKQDCTFKYGEARYHIIHHGIDLSHYDYRPDKKDYFLHMGLVAPHKGHDITFEIVKRTGIKVIMAGEDKFVPRKDYVEYVKDKCQKLGIDYLGGVSDEKKIELMQNARGLILPFQIGEAFSLLAIESFSCGTPVITSNMGSMPEIMHEGVGWMCSTIKAYVYTVTHLLHKTYYQECRKYAEEHFDRKRMAQDYLDLFTRAMNKERW